MALKIFAITYRIMRSHFVISLNLSFFHRIQKKKENMDIQEAGGCWKSNCGKYTQYKDVPCRLTLHY